MTSFDAELEHRLDAIRRQHLLRGLRRVDSPQSTRVTIDSRAFLNFSSNDYLGLANHPALKNAAIEAIKKYGAGTGASRLVCGSLSPFHELEETLAVFKGTEAALTFSTGYATSLGAITALIGKEDIIAMDKLVHASIVDAAKLSGAKMRIFPHNDLEALEDILKWATTRTKGTAARTLVVTESIFSMDGDAAPLKEMVKLKDKYGVWLMVDEAHATGLYGKKQRGLIEAMGLSGQIEVQMGTLGKAIGASGGYICGSRALVDLLINRARSFIFSTAPVPAAAASAKVGIDLIGSSEGRKLNDTLWGRIEKFKNSFPKTKIASAIIPIILGDETKAIAVATQLYDKNILVPAIRYPTVRRGAARLRVTLNAAHSLQDMEKLV
ncbi:MAG TPA: 8-amino-7-oxononanoate synthase, partial [Verrucomicrobiae bacterium]|nr:8-amino-7-oxononanoate synthase [Verrucomicrobiae bacterium]